jgi:hypothetical protein
MRMPDDAHRAKAIANAFSRPDRLSNACRLRVHARPNLPVLAPSWRSGSVRLLGRGAFAASPNAAVSQPGAEGP